MSNTLALERIEIPIDVLRRAPAMVGMRIRILHCDRLLRLGNFHSQAVEHEQGTKNAAGCFHPAAGDQTATEVRTPPRELWLVANGGGHGVGEDRERGGGRDHGERHKRVVIVAFRGNRGADGYGLFRAGGETSDGDNDFVALEGGGVTWGSGEGDIIGQQQAHLRAVERIGRVVLEQHGVGERSSRLNATRGGKRRGHGVRDFRLGDRPLIEKRGGTRRRSGNEQSRRGIHFCVRNGIVQRLAVDVRAKGSRIGGSGR